jgi:bifunctional DNA-binding transcriptional regulator/antitoxin component of YhaV-PrlF toxin-antitoxin module
MAANNAESTAREGQLLREIKALPTTSARIRALDERGMTKGDIVKFLNAHFKEPGRPHAFRYQHVYNVLSQGAGGRRPAPSERDTEHTMARLPERLDVQLDSAGRIVIPAVYRGAMQAKEGDRLMARVVDGELRLITPRMAVRLAQKMVRETIPGGDSLVDTLIEQRRKEYEDEFGDG